MRRGGPQRLFRLLVRLYPAGHRRMFGEQMLQTFRDHYRDVVEERGGSRLRFWWSVLLDVAVSLTKERIAALGAWRPRRPVAAAGARRWRPVADVTARRRRPRIRTGPRAGARQRKRRLRYRRHGRRPARVLIRTRHRRVVYRGRMPELIAALALTGSALAGGALIGRLGVGGLVAGLTVAGWLARGLRLTRPVAAGLGGDGPAPPGGASVREPRRPLPVSPAGCAARPDPGPEDPGHAIALI